jgi:hypothetical protein
VSAITEPSREPKGWELSLNALCADDTARTVRFLTGAVMACGGFVLSRRFDAGETAAIEFEFVRAMCVEMYSVLIAAGLQLTAQSHLIMASLCQCTRETRPPAIRSEWNLLFTNPARSLAASRVDRQRHRKSPRRSRSRQLRDGCPRE